MYIVQPTEEKYIVLYCIIFYSHLCWKFVIWKWIVKIKWNINEKQMYYKRWVFIEWKCIKIRCQQKCQNYFFLSMCDVKVSLRFTSLSLVLLWQLFYLFCTSIVMNTVIVTAGDFESWKREVWHFKIWFNPPFL
jgi:hypothetical protein